MNVTEYPGLVGALSIYGCDLLVWRLPRAAGGSPMVGQQDRELPIELLAGVGVEPIPAVEYS